MSAIARVEAGFRAAVRSCGYFRSEYEFQEALCRQLGRPPRCEREPPVQFGPPLYPPPEPPPTHQPARDVCQQRGKPKLDLLMRLGSEFVAIELKYGRIPDWIGAFNGSPIPVITRADVLTYYFLKDIHRLERLTEVHSRTGSVFPQHRICAVLTNYPWDFEGHTIHDRIRIGARTIEGHLVQYNMKPPRRRYRLERRERAFRRKNDSDLRTSNRS